MIAIKEISEQIEDELHGSDEYIRKALKYKESDRVLADAYYQMSLQEMQHVNALHEQGVRLINEHKVAGKIVPEAMQAVYDYLHERQIEKTNEVKMLQSQYR